jgi:hypothetical protein
MAADGYRQQLTNSGDGNGRCNGDSNNNDNSKGDGNGNSAATTKVTTINNKWQQKKWRRRCGAFCK